MKSTLLALALTIAALGTGAAVAQDAMSSPMQSGDMMMTPNQMMSMCLEKAAMTTDAMVKADNEKACHTVQNLLMGDAMSAQPMAPDAMAPNAMAGGAMAPAQ